uniref:Uncharacterized protein n=1 Tax=Triticum urartu TaxID=4572 RepID=A0A8R7PDD3_TRIUA
SFPYSTRTPRLVPLTLLHSLPSPRSRCRHAPLSSRLSPRLSAVAAAGLLSALASLLSPCCVASPRRRRLALPRVSVPPNFFLTFCSKPATNPRIWRQRGRIWWLRGRTRRIRASTTTRWGLRRLDTFEVLPRAGEYRCSTLRRCQAPGAGGRETLSCRPPRGAATGRRSCCRTPLSDATGRRRCDHDDVPDKERRSE